jgi:hypothetical protein
MEPLGSLAKIPMTAKVRCQQYTHKAAQPAFWSILTSSSGEVEPATTAGSVLGTQRLV